MHGVDSQQVILDKNIHSNISIHSSKSVHGGIRNPSDSRPRSLDMSVSARSSAEPTNSNGNSQRRISMDEQPERHIAVATVSDSRPLHSERGSVPHHRVVLLDNVSFSIDVESIYSQSRFSFKETNGPSRDLKL